MFPKSLETFMKKTLKIACEVTCEPGFQYVTHADVITDQRNGEEKETVILVVMALLLCCHLAKLHWSVWV
jgi:hypothetical protein